MVTERQIMQNMYFYIIFKFLHFFQKICLFVTLDGRLNSSVDRRRGYQLDDQGIVIKKNRQKKKFSVLQTAMWPGLQTCSMVTGGYCQEKKRRWCEADYSPTYSAEKKNEGSMPPIHHKSLNGKQRHVFAFNLSRLPNNSVISVQYKSTASIGDCI